MIEEPPGDCFMGHMKADLVQHTGCLIQHTSFHANHQSTHGDVLSPEVVLAHSGPEAGIFPPPKHDYEQIGGPLELLMPSADSVISVKRSELQVLGRWLIYSQDLWLLPRN